MKGFVGDTAIETRVATVSDAEPPMSPAVAVTVAVPAACALTEPAFPAELLTVAAAGFEEVHTTD